MDSLDVNCDKLTVRKLKKLRKSVRRLRKNPQHRNRLAYLNGIIRGKQELYYGKQQKTFLKLMDESLAALAKTKTMQHLKRIFEQKSFIPRGSY